jgi:thiamine biosynthesis lipoprotein
MGSPVTITIDADDSAKAKLAARAALEELERLDRMLSDWKETSDLTTFNRSSELTQEVPESFARCLERALQVSTETNGLFDPTVAPLVQLWREARKSQTLPDAESLAAARAKTGFKRVQVAGSQIRREDASISIDFGGIGKGFGAIAALETLRNNGCPRAMVAVAGDLAIGEPPRGEPGWKVDIESAAQSERIVVARCAVSTSGATEQFVEINSVRYAHIVDSRTGLGAINAARATVIGPLDAAVDALGTALALTQSDAEVDAILARFPEYGARIERSRGEAAAGGEVASNASTTGATENAPTAVTYHGAWKR